MENLKRYVKRQYTKLLPRINITYWICDHLVGRTHKPKHRIATGTVIIIIGISLLNIGEFPFLIITHTFGAIFHAVGAAPWVELIIEKYQKDNKS